MIASCKSAYSRYETFLKTEAENRKLSEREKRKLEICEEIKEGNRKRQKLLDRIIKETKMADDLLLKAEVEEDFSMLQRANSKRKDVSKMKDEVAVMEKAVEDKETMLKEL